MTESKISRRSMLKWTGALAAAFAVGAGTGYSLLKPSPPPPGVTTTTTAPPPEEEVKVFTNQGYWVYVKNGRIIRQRPMRLPQNRIQKTWDITVGNRVFSPILRTLQGPRVSHYMLTLNRRVYSSKRLLYPMKRVDWSPTDRNTQNRGKSKFVRITWEEALTTIASELKRVNEKYGPSAILHGPNWSHVHPGGSGTHMQWNVYMNRILCAAFGGHTCFHRNPDSWEGWHYGGSFAWGYSWLKGVAPKSNLEDAMKNSKMIVNWAHDQLGQSAEGAYTEFQPWLKELGIKRVYVSPDYNYSAAAYADTWIPILHGDGDRALAAAIAYVWISEGTYDTKYVYSHCYGFDDWKNYVIGKEDGVPKTPEWAEPKCGVKARIIRALARQWAKVPTMLGQGNGGHCRTPYAEDNCRMLVYIMAMQGLGKPGRSISTLTEEPTNPSVLHKKESNPSHYYMGNWSWIADAVPMNKYGQFIWRIGFAESILNPPQSWYGMVGPSIDVMPPKVTPWFPHKDFIGGPGWPPDAPKTPQYGTVAYKNTYPLPGYSEIHAMLAGGSMLFGVYANGGEKLVRAYQSPKIEFIARMDYHWGGDMIFSDILLPLATVFERDDVMLADGGTPLQKCVEPRGESKSDFDVEAELAKKLGVYEQVHEGRTQEQWMEKMFNNYVVSEYMTWKEFNNMKGSYPEGTLPTSFQVPWDAKKVGQKPRSNPWSDYAKLPEGKGLDTKSGKIEFYSQWLKEWFPDDTERLPVAHFKPSWEGLESPLAQKYPLLVDSGHPRFRHHTQFDDCPWLWEIPSNKVMIDGYPYEALWINPKDAAARGIKKGDIVRVFNDRGQGLFGAYVTERVIPGVIRAPDGGFYDPTDPGNPYSPDKGGCMNFLAPSRYTSAPYGSGGTVNAYLVQAEKWTAPVPPSAWEQRLKEGVS